MLAIDIICVGKLKEKYYFEAANEYSKRLATYCKVRVIEIGEQTRVAGAQKAAIRSALNKEATAIEAKIPRGALVIAMCVEGRPKSSEELSELLNIYTVSGVSKICFIIGGSDGLHESIKSRSDMLLSVSKMTFPHHLMRVILLEQIYRAFKIIEGGKYHK